jgi:hypothetical protein
MNNTDPTKTGFTEKYVYKADFDKKIIWASFTLKSLSPLNPN